MGGTATEYGGRDGKRDCRRACVRGGRMAQRYQLPDENTGFHYAHLLIAAIPMSWIGFGAANLTWGYADPDHRAAAHNAMTPVQPWVAAAFSIGHAELSSWEFVHGD